MVARNLQAESPMDNRIGFLGIKSHGLLDDVLLSVGPLHSPGRSRLAVELMRRAEVDGKGS